MSNVVGARMAPIRCRVIDDGAFTPEASRPYIGKLGWVFGYDTMLQYVIQLDDGSLLQSSECWWEAVD